MSNKKFFAILAISCGALVVYAVSAYFFSMEYVKWTNVPLTIFLSVLMCLPTFTLWTVYSKAKRKDEGLKKPVIIGVIAFAADIALFWALLSLINVVIFNSLGNVQAVIAVGIASSLQLATAYVITFVRLSKIDRRIFFRVSAAAVAVILILFSVLQGVRFDFEAIKQSRLISKVENASTSEVTFETVSASDLGVSESEKNNCKEWYETNILYAGNNGVAPAYDFTVGGKSLSKNFADWEFSVGEASATGAVYSGGNTSYITVKSAKYSLTATVEATIYPDNATCDWTVYIKNTGEGNSKTVKDFYALKGELATGGDSELYYSLGSPNSSKDFELRKIEDFSSTMSFFGVGGRSTDTYLSYFNVCGKDGGYVLGVGWTGQWLAEFTEKGDNFKTSIGQKTFEAYLTSGEEVRSPLVSLSFYDGDNALIGFNAFRAFVSDCVYPEGVDTFSMLEVAGPFSTRSTDEILTELDKIDADIMDDFDYFWMDAGWYATDRTWSDAEGKWIIDWTDVGTWTADPDRYVNGIKEISDYGKEKGIGLVLWYEPERVKKGETQDTYLYTVGKAHEDWIIENGSDTNLWNFACDDALSFMCEYVSASLIENGVSVYRQDFNMEPLTYWETADKNIYGGRKGICENRYVTNYYKYLDYLFAHVDGLLMDNCASGGRRLDLEMTRRSVPLWRSDYNCESYEDILKANQAQTLGISMWFPLSGTANYVGSEYAARSAVMPCVINTFASVTSKYYCDYSELRVMQTEYFCPLTPCNTDADRFLAMQYSSYDGDSGFAVVYKREDVESETYTVEFNALNPDVIYNVYDYDNSDTTVQKSGAELMKGYEITIKNAPKSVIIVFNKA